MLDNPRDKPFQVPDVSNPNADNSEDNLLPAENKDLGILDDEEIERSFVSPHSTRERPPEAVDTKRLNETNSYK